MNLVLEGKDTFFAQLIINTIYLLPTTEDPVAQELHLPCVLCTFINSLDVVIIFVTIVCLFMRPISFNV